MKKKTLYLLALVCLSTNSISAQTTRDEIFNDLNKAGGVYYAYPVTESANTPAPKGYKPFYVSHYGRHGSRYLIGDEDLKWIVDLMDKAEKADALTPLGRDVASRLDAFWQEMRGRGGELTPLGTRQHKGIARRMITAYPEVFAGNPEVTAASTQVMRCAHSMMAFSEGLKEVKPELDIPKESSKRNMYYLCYHSPEYGVYNNDKGPWKQEFVKFEDRMTNPDRLMKALFKDDKFVLRNVNPKDLMRGLYWVTVDLQNAETPVTLTDIFDPQELMDLWQIYNYSFYIHDSSYPLGDGLAVDNAKNLLTHMVENADRFIRDGKNGATLRFGHDGNIVPLTALMRLENCYAYEMDPDSLYKSWTNFKISPMASNVQMVFFKDKKDNVIVKFMLNEREIAIPVETDMFPFYSWNDARAHLQRMIETPAKAFIPENIDK